MLDQYQILSTKMLTYAAENKKGENIVCSPFSLLMLLTLAMNGTSGVTSKEIEAVLSKEPNRREINKEIKKLEKALTKKKKGFTLNSANGICVDDKFFSKILPKYTEKMKTCYDADVFLGGDSPKNAINTWVDKKTEGLIKELLSKDPEDFAVCLLNAIYFNAKWENSYTKYEIETDFPFHNADKTETSVSLLTSTEHAYVENDSFTGFIKDYKGGQFAFMALLPKDENALLSKELLTGIDFHALYHSVEDYEVNAGIPEFSLEKELDLKAFCNDLGICRVFTDQANFKRMITEENIKATSLMQKAVIKVDRCGTKAAAVSGMICTLAAFPEFDRIKTVTLDRPFVFAVISKEYEGLPVFVGCVNKL